MATSPEENHASLSQYYTPLKGQSYKKTCLSIIRNPILKKRAQNFENQIEKAFYQSLKWGIICFFSLMILWFLFGYAQGKNQHQRGNHYAHWRKLRKLIKKQKQDSDLHIGKLPLLKDKETSHILITGTTGSGKTNTFHTLLPQIRQRGNRAIILDVTGDYVSRYYNEKTEIILNPLDTRSVPWHPWADCHLDSHYNVLAESFIQPKEGSKDPFWDNASRGLFKTALQKYAEQKVFDIERLIHFLLTSSEKEFEDFFKNTEAATYANKSNDKTTSSIRSVLSSQISCLKQLETPEKSFSLREWVLEEAKEKERESWLFLTARPDQRQTLAPLLTAWIDIAINGLMVLPENAKMRLWFLIDELAALQRLPRLAMGLAEGRKYGGCFLIGFQSKPQLEEIYGRNQCEAMLDLVNTKVFFRSTEPATQQWISKVLGEKEEIEPTENISYGAHSMRDGVSLSRHTRQIPLILPGELSLLQNLECYLKYPGAYPCTKLKTKYQHYSFIKKEAFTLKSKKKHATTSLPEMLPAIQSTDFKGQIIQEKRKVEKIEFLKS